MYDIISKIKITREGNSASDKIWFEITNCDINPEEFDYLAYQAKLGYDPRGYGHSCLLVGANYLKWYCWGSCD